MKRLIAKMEAGAFKLSFRAKQGIKDLITKEDGDTNFISIIIVLIIVVGIAAIIIGFKKDLAKKFTEVVGGFLDTLG